MTEKEEQKPNTPETPKDLRGTLVKRLAIAGGLVAVLLGVLAFFDYLSTSEEPESPTYTQPVPVQPRKEVTQPVKPAESLPEPPAPEPTPEKPAETPPKPEVPPTPAPPSKPSPEAQQPEPKVPTVRPTPQGPAAKPVPPAMPTPLGAPAQPKPAKPVPPVPEATVAPTPRLPPETRPALVPQRPSELAMPVQPVPAPMRLFPGYVLQAGVFTSVQRAEEIHAKLTLNGIPSTLEARVQAGPFKTREEAAAAREKMKALGIDTVLIPPKGGR